MVSSADSESPGGGWRLGGIERRVEIQCLGPGPAPPAVPGRGMCVCVCEGGLRLAGPGSARLPVGNAHPRCGAQGVKMIAC
jgi:hypothetical protein